MHHSIEYRELLRTLDNDEAVRIFMDEKLNERGELAAKAVSKRMEKAQVKHTEHVTTKLSEYKE